MVMPGGMSGAQLLDRVRNNYPHIQRLLTSGYADKTELPVDGTLWLRKPYSINEMSNIFDQLLG
jgi:CheY-like chemotaxis protein